MSQDAFRDYVTNTAFHLHLTRRQCDVLMWIADGNDAGWANFGHFVPVVRHLKDKGLVLHHYIPPDKAPPGHRYYTLTEAGEHVAALVRLAGLARSQVARAA